MGRRLSPAPHVHCSSPRRFPRAAGPRVPAAPPSSANGVPRRGSPDQAAKSRADNGLTDPAGRTGWRDAARLSWRCRIACRSGATASGRRARRRAGLTRPGRAQRSGHRERDADCGGRPAAPARRRPRVPIPVVSMPSPDRARPVRGALVRVVPRVLSGAALALLPAVRGAAAQPPVVVPRPALAEPALSPDGREIAFVSGGDVWTVGADGGEARLLVSHPAHESRPLWSPDGKRLAFVSTRTGGGDVYVLELASGTVRRVTFDDAAEMLDAWSRDGSGSTCRPPRATSPACRTCCASRPMAARRWSSPGTATRASTGRRPRRTAARSRSRRAG